jgi:hypothetical protein
MSLDSSVGFFSGLDIDQSGVASVVMFLADEASEFLPILLSQSTLQSQFALLLRPHSTLQSQSTLLSAKDFSLYTYLFLFL